MNTGSSRVRNYQTFARRKRVILWGLCLSLILAGGISLIVGAKALTFRELWLVITGQADGRLQLLVWQIRLPRIVGAVVSGAGLALAGCVMQNVLANPLASPSTLGVSSGAAFGANLAIVFLGSSGIMLTPYLISLSAFSFSLLATLIVLALAKLRRFSAEAILLAGVALSSIFSAGTAIAQYFATDLQLGAAVFWSFGDLGRINWREIVLLSLVVIGTGGYFLRHSWDYNALCAGEASAHSLGVKPEGLRFRTMLISAVVTSLCVSFIGLIGFIGLIAPHAIRRILGEDHRYLLPASGLAGAIVLLLSDTLARVIISPVVLPVGAITSLLGGPMFIYLLISRRKA